jgi:hypothetical protein
MKNEIYVVTVDTRDTDASDIEGYKEYTLERNTGFLDSVLVHNPLRVKKCVKSAVAKLCGLDMKIYFHEHGVDDMRSFGQNNGAATMLTMDPDTGFARHQIQGKAYVIVDDGNAPLSRHQVWGIQELICCAKPIYHHFDRDFKQRGKEELLQSCLEYRTGDWGPRFIYYPRLIPEVKD